MADKTAQKVEALQLTDQNQNVKIINNWKDLETFKIPESDEDKINLIRNTEKAAEHCKILISWCNGRIAYVYANGDEEQESTGDTIDSALDKLKTELGFAKSTIYNYYALYQRCELEKLNKFSEAGVSWSIIRQYVLNRNRDTGDKMMDFIETQIDENNGKIPDHFEKEQLKTKLAELTGNDGQKSPPDSSSSSQGAVAAPPAEEDQMLEILQSLKDRMDKFAQGLEGYASDFFSGHRFREYIEQLFTVDFDEAQAQKRDQLLVELINQFTRTLQVLVDLQIDSAMYSKANKEEVASAASTLINLFGRDGLTPVVYEDNTVGVDLNENLGEAEEEQK